MFDFKVMAEAAYENTVKLRRELHMHPELSGKENNTIAFICRRLDELGVSYEVYPNNHGVTATVGRGERAVGLRGDMDALPITEQTGLCYASQNPGVMHACGHDIHTAVLLGIAEMFKKVEDELPGTVKLFFQPNEEAEGGAENMIKHGCMDNPEVKNVLALHIDPVTEAGRATFQPGKTQAKVISLRIKVKGKECHGAHPEQGVDAIMMAAQTITALQTVNSRLTAPAKPVVISIGVIEGGRKSNIVAGEVNMHGTIRVLENAVGESVKYHVRQICESVAAAWGGSAEVYMQDEYPALTNDRGITMDMAELCKKYFGKQSAVFLEDVSMGADDFAYFTSRAPGCYFNIGTRGLGQGPQVLHTPDLAPDESCLMVGLTLMSAGAVMLLERNDDEAGDD